MVSFPHVQFSYRLRRITRVTAYAPDDHESATADEEVLYAAQDQFEEIDPRRRCLLVCALSGS